MTVKEIKLKEYCKYINKQLAKQGKSVNAVKQLTNRIIWMDRNGAIIYARQLVV